jgi:ubiquinone/menaquinone biosynthesis C-methylase UbiE
LSPGPRHGHARGTRERFDRLAPAYDRRWPRYIEESVTQTLGRLDVDRARDVLDVGCGTGALLAAIDRARGGNGAPRLAGVDLSSGMLAVARGKLGRRGALAVADAARLPFPRARFDLAVSSSALHHWREPLRALREMARVLRPGGRVAITDWCGDRWVERFRTRILRRREHDRLRVYRSGELAALLQEAGFVDVLVERWRIGWRWSLMTATATTSAPP